MTPTGATRVCAVIGDPVRHSLSPLLHNEAFRVAGLDWVYVALPVASLDGHRAVDAMRTLGIDGLSVTMPHKTAVFESLEHVTDEARSLGSCNTVFRDGDRLVGDSTDGRGFVRALDEAQVDLAQKRCVVLGAGGAGRAVIAALVAAKVASITVVNRDAERAEQAVAMAGQIGAFARSTSDIEDAVKQATIIINATPLGMREDDPLPINPELLNEQHIVNDLIYSPLSTGLLEEATRRGAIALNGLGMLLHQATLQFERWTGAAAPVEAMRAVLRAELDRRSAGQPK